MTIEKRTELLERTNSGKEHWEILVELEQYVHRSNSYYFRSVVRILSLYLKYEKDRKAGVLSKIDISTIENILTYEIIEVILGIYKEQLSLPKVESAMQRMEEIKGKFWQLEEDDRIYELQKFFKKYDSFFSDRLAHYISERDAKIDKFSDDHSNYRKVRLNIRLLELIDKVILEKQFVSKKGIEKLISYEVLNNIIGKFKKSNIESGLDKFEEHFLLKRADLLKKQKIESFLALRKLNRQINTLALEHEDVNQEYLKGANSPLSIYKHLNKVLTIFFDAIEDHIINFGFDFFEEVKVDEELKEQIDFAYVSDLMEAKKHIAKFEIKKVFGLLEKVSNSIPKEFDNDIIMIKSRWNKNEKRRLMGIEYEPNYENAISYTLIELIEEIINSAANKGYGGHAS